jgi:hypothetical protein
MEDFLFSHFSYHIFIVQVYIDIFNVVVFGMPYNNGLRNSFVNTFTKYIMRKTI